MSLELLAYAVAFAGSVAAVLIALYFMRFRKGSEEEVPSPAPVRGAGQRWRHRALRSVSTQDARAADDKLRTLGLEREILSDAIRRLYEAHAEELITEEERERLAKLYKGRMMKVREAITESESVVALHELEAMQEDLTKLFNDRFDELSTKIETLRAKVGVETEGVIVPTPMPAVEQIEVPTVEASPPKKRRKKPQSKPPTSRRTAAEERIERIKSEVEKVLDRLEQMEAEG